MAVDTSYREFPILMKSLGIVARQALDRSPVGFWLNENNAEERVEEAISSRLGSVIINRDPNSTPGGVNYFLLNPVTCLSRLKALNGQTFRYANSGPALYRRAGDSQGIYQQIYNALSGLPFSSLVGPSFQSALPFLYIYDSEASIKDSGTGSPTQIGIFGPLLPMTALVDAPTATLVDTFQSASGYTTAGFTISGLSPVGSVNGTAEESLLHFKRYTCSDRSVNLIQAGMLGVSTTANLQIVFHISQDTSFFDIANVGGASTNPDTFSFTSVNGSVAANAVATIGKTASFDFSGNDPDDIFMLAFQVSNPAAIQEIRLQLDVNNSGYTSSYYYKSITPASFQTAISNPSVNAPGEAVASEVFDRAAGISPSNQVGFPAANLLPTDDPVLQLLQPQQMTTGAGSWTVALLPLGSFLPVGNAGSPGLDWSAITGWQIQITTTSQGSTNVAFNALYLQSGGGASSYGGVGYDFRQTFYNANTGTESNPSGEQYFAITPTNPNGVSNLYPLRQTVGLFGSYSTDPQVTHARVYSRGGVLSNNWQLVDQIPNNPLGGNFQYNYITPDSQLLEADLLNLANDVPVTSTLQNPIVTTLSSTTTPAVSILQPVQPVTIDVADATAVFVPNQIVDIGTPANLEQVVVVTGGTGSFTAAVQLVHQAGELVQVFALPGVHCNLAAQAYNLYWLAGDPNNPHLLYYNNAGYPENFGPQNYIAVSSPADPITGVVNFRGTLFVKTLTTWYQIFPGPPPYSQSTGSKHGSASPFGWTITESSIFYEALDGIREFQGADGEYLTLIIEWLFQNINQSLTPIPELDLTQLASIQMAFWNNIVFISYQAQDGKRYRLLYHDIYKRFRNDSIAATALYVEADTNTLLYAKSMPQGGYAIVQDRIGDYDDGGWVGGVLVETPISFTLQTPYLDMGSPNNQKQFNVFTIDANPNGQSLSLTLLWDDGGTISPISLGTFTGATRQKFLFILNSGAGQQAYRVSIQITGSVTVAPEIYQASFHAAILPEQVQSYDSYWHKFGTDESKLVKQGYFDYTSIAPITVNLFADGSTIPYYTFTLPANPNRLQVPMRVRFPVAKCRLWRQTSTSSGAYQNWSALQVDWKPVCGPPSAKGYVRGELPVT